MEWQGENCAHIENYKENEDWESRVDLMIRWINDEERPANLVVLYFDQPDNEMHYTGSASNEVSSINSSRRASRSIASF